MMDRTMDEAQAGMWQQLAPLVEKILKGVRPIIDQPVIRMPYILPLARSASISAGASGFILPTADFSHSLTWPFEVNRIKFSQDPSHTFRDWRVAIQDQTFNQPFQKSNVMVDLAVMNNTGTWELPFPWVVRPLGGGLQVGVDNLDTVNPITVDISFEGSLLIPR